MKKTLRGRPKLAITLFQILEVVKRHGQVVAAARELRCSDAYIHMRLKRSGLSLWQILEADSLEDLYWIAR